LFMLWTVLLPTDQATKPPLCPTGGVGSGKTRVARGVFDLFGLTARIAAVTKNGETDFWTALDAGGLCCFDNADTRVEWLADALAAAATAGNMVKRKLYSDGDNVIQRARASVIVTSANPVFGADAGLADRLLVVRLSRRQGETAESRLTDEVVRHRDAGLSWIAWTLARALADTGPTPERLNARHPDFAAMAVRVGRVLGIEDQAVAALRTAEADKSRFAIENDSLLCGLLDVIGGPWTGTAADLRDLLVEADPGLDGKLSPKRLGKRMTALWPHLESLFLATKERTERGSTYSLRPTAGTSPDVLTFESTFSGKPPTRGMQGTLSESPPETSGTSGQPALPWVEGAV